MITSSPVRVNLPVLSDLRGFASGASNTPSPSDSPQETFEKSSAPESFSKNAQLFAMGGVVGAVANGVPGALAMGAVHGLLQGGTTGLMDCLGFGALAAGVGVVSVPVGLMVAAMSADAGNKSGANGYLAGTALALGGAALLVF